MDLECVPELNYRSYCINRNKLFDIPEQSKNFLNNFDNLDEPIDEEKLLKEYEDKNSLVKNGIYTYLLILNKENNKIEGFLKKIKLIKEKVENNSKLFESEQLKENFILDSNEFIYFKKNMKLGKKIKSRNFRIFQKRE